MGTHTFSNSLSRKLILLSLKYNTIPNSTLKQKLKILFKILFIRKIGKFQYFPVIQYTQDRLLQIMKKKHSEFDAVQE